MTLYRRAQLQGDTATALFWKKNPEAKNGSHCSFRIHAKELKILQPPSRRPFIFFGGSTSERGARVVRPYCVSLFLSFQPLFFSLHPRLITEIARKGRSEVRSVSFFCKGHRRPCGVLTRDIFSVIHRSAGRTGLGVTCSLPSSGVLFAPPPFPWGRFCTPRFGAPALRSVR
jgi:hypothetical protein